MKTMTLVIAWAWVSAVLGWGVYQSVQKSLPLFTGSAKPASTIKADRRFPAQSSN